jgi:hypothetical protein
MGADLMPLSFEEALVGVYLKLGTFWEVAVVI